MGMQVAALKTVRLGHHYLGVFLAPAILFFTFTGALQAFSFHESTTGSSYKPANWIVVLAQIHKKQTTQLPAHKPQPPASSPAGTSSSPETTVSPAQATNRAVHHPLPLKMFFLIVCVGLSASTATGLYMSYKYSRKKLLLAILFLAGIVVPIFLTTLA
jgi:hypothetical protein